MSLLLGIAASFHAGAAVAALTRARLPASRRVLATALIATVPLAGIALAIAVCRVRGAGGSPALHMPRATTTDRARFEAVARDEAPIAEQLVGERDERRAAVSSLVRSGDPEAVRTLRWLIERGSGEAVVEAALALEQLAQQRQRAVQVARGDAAASGDWRRWLGAAEMITEDIESGLVDPSAIPTLCDAARAMYRAAAESAAGLPAELAAGWANLELIAARAADALDILARGDDTDDVALRSYICTLRDDALFAARLDPGGADAGGRA
jgi:hypothetical protein